MSSKSKTADETKATNPAPAPDQPTTLAPAPMAVSTLTGSYAAGSADADAVAEAVKAIIADEPRMVASIRAMRAPDDERRALALWAYHFIERRVFAMLADKAAATFKTKAAWLADRFGTTDARDLKRWANHFDYLRRVGAEILDADGASAPTSKTSADDALAQYLSKAVKRADLTVKGKVAAYRALAPAWADISAADMADILGPLVAAYDAKCKALTAAAAEALAVAA